MGTPQETPPRQDLLAEVLRDVSRSFYRTLRVLPARVRPQISLAYRLARTSDTIADSGSAPVRSRLAALDEFRARITGVSDAPLRLVFLRSRETPPGEQTLLLRVEESISLLQTFPGADRDLIIKVLETIITGQRQDLLRFPAVAHNPPNTNHAAPTPLQTAEELDNYTYMVAGCVGEFWTRICRLHLFPAATLDEELLVAEGIRFGKGLQLVNILRDIPSDLRQGRCYIPLAHLNAAELTPEDLLNPEKYPRFKPVYQEWISRAEEHLRAGWRYTNRLPWAQPRVRLACAWPLLIGFETLRILRAANVLEPATRLKVPRPWVKRMILKTILLYPVPALWSKPPPS
jgi:farnesyl-diphosphate farnesyltransferase